MIHTELAGRNAASGIASNATTHAESAGDTDDIAADAPVPATR